MMLARCNAVCEALPGSVDEPMCAVRWPVHGSVSLESASTSDRNTNGNIVDDVVSDVAGSSVSSLVEDDDDLTWATFHSRVIPAYM